MIDSPEGALIYYMLLYVETNYLEYLENSRTESLAASKAEKWM